MNAAGGGGGRRALALPTPEGLRWPTGTKRSPRGSVCSAVVSRAGLGPGSGSLEEPGVFHLERYEVIRK